MSSLYTWLLFVHVIAVGAFLVAHGVSAAAGFALKSNPGESHTILRLSQRSAMIGNPALLLILATGIWMGFIESWWKQGWIWAAIVVLVLVAMSMGLMSRPFYMARQSEGAQYEAAAARTRPIAMAWIGSIGLAVLFFLMVFKPF